MKKQLFRIICIIYIIPIVCSCNSPEKKEIKLAQLPIALSLVTRVADQHDFFKNANIKCSVISEPAGPAVVNALKSNAESSPTCGTIAITPTVTMIASKQKPVIIGTILYSKTEVKLVSFASKHITDNPNSLKGKRIGLVRNTIGDIYFSRLLKKIHLKPEDVIIVNGKPGDLKNLLLKNNIDAAVLWTPFATQCATEAKLQTSTKDDEVVISNDSTLYTVSMHIVTTEQKLKENRAGLVKFLKALTFSESYIQNNLGSVQSDFEKWLGLKTGELNDFITHSRFTVDLNVPQTKEFLTSELQWLKESKKDAYIPGDLSPFIDASLLKEVDPKRVKE